MTLIKSISGIRGTIGGQQGHNLTPVDVVEFSAAFGTWLHSSGKKLKVVIGRDGRISGPMISGLVTNTLLMQGIEVVDLGLSTTPTVELVVTDEKAGGGIIITASHNPGEYNALKFLNEKGEFISPETGQKILQLIMDNQLKFTEVNQLGSVRTRNNAVDFHIKKILDLDILDIPLIRSKKFRVVIDCINSSGSISMVPLLRQLGCDVIAINDEIKGSFAHNPEPLEKHLTQLSHAVIQHKADMGIAVDPDVDRLAFMCENGVLFGEEFTLVAVADFVLSKQKGNTVSNMSSSRALADITEKHGCRYKASAVGEVHVVAMMKQMDAIIGGEGNGGVIYPLLHYGRDALVGAALFLNLVAERAVRLSQLRLSYPDYVMVKDKITLSGNANLQEIIDGVESAFKGERINTSDGIKIDFDDGWVHLRKSNTEPIIRIYSEGNDLKTAERLILKVKENISLSLK